MIQPLMSLVLLLGLSVSIVRAADPIVLREDDMKISSDATVKKDSYRVADPQGDGAIRIIGDDITVDFQGAELQGNTPEQKPDQFTGIGIFIQGRNITVRNLKVSGYKVGIHAVNCPGLLIEDSDISGNYQKHLLSTPEAEDGSDWIFPHRNDDKEWMNNYGAGLYVESSDEVTIRRVRARHGQNGIIIDRVNNSKLYDNDCSFLSGWGLAMWRSNDNVITRNAFDFCVRGYSHGVYNRGQDSAGILMFEQNSRNVIAENSATHGGDGFFGFAGNEALGDKPAEDFDYERAGNNDNLLIGNDFSHSPAHGIEMTFSFGNQYIDNRLVDNAICGVWGGYSQDTLIAGNEFADNGERGYGLERGGVNIDSGRDNRILDNHFQDNKCGVHLWGPASAGFMQKPWAKANRPAADDNIIHGNTFEGDALVLHLRGEVTDTVFAGNTIKNVGETMKLDEGIQLQEKVDEEKVTWQRTDYPVHGETRPVGARKELRGRKNIIMTEWGPYDFQDTIVYPKEVTGGDQAVVRIYGPSGTFQVTDSTGDVNVSPKQGDLPGSVTVSIDQPGLHPFTLSFDAGGKKLNVKGSLLRTEWDVRFYKWSPDEDPREHPDRWKEIIAGEPVEQRKVGGIDFKWGGGAASPQIGADHFGTVAEATIDLPAGDYRLRSVSDDGIRVWIDGKQVIDDWTWHPPKENTAEVTLQKGEHEFRIEHFEINGTAQLQFQLEPINKP